MVDIETANVTPTGNWDMTGGDVKVPVPTVDTDASTKKYVDDSAGGLSQEGVEDFAGALMAKGTGTHTGVTITYQDATNDMDFVVDHDATLNFVANEHLDWTTDQGATNIHAGNYTDTDTTDHTAFSNIGTNSHAQIDTSITATGLNTTHRSSDGSDHSLSHAESHTILSHSDTTATGAELDTLTGGGDTTLHDHDGISENTTHRSSDGTDHANVVLNDTHRADNTQAHSDYLLNSGADTGVQLTLTGDNSSADTQYTAQVLYNTDATPPTASNFPIGTIYIQYTA